MGVHTELEPRGIGMSCVGLPIRRRVLETAQQLVEDVVISSRGSRLDVNNNIRSTERAIRYSRAARRRLRRIATEHRRTIVRRAFRISRLACVRTSELEDKEEGSCLQSQRW
jgi:hypothetical protein